MTEIFNHPDTIIHYRKNLQGTKEALDLEAALSNQMPDWMAEKLALAIIALVEASTEKAI